MDYPQRLEPKWLRRSRLHNGNNWRTNHKHTLENNVIHRRRARGGTQHTQQQIASRMKILLSMVGDAISVSNVCACVCVRVRDRALLAPVHVPLRQCPRSSVRVSHRACVSVCASANVAGNDTGTSRNSDITAPRMRRGLSAAKVFSGQPVQNTLGDLVPCSSLCALWSRHKLRQQHK